VALPDDMEMSKHVGVQII